jgi:hypothetical protein
MPLLKQNKVKYTDENYFLASYTSNLHVKIRWYIKAGYTSKPQNKLKDLCLVFNCIPHRAQIFCLNFIKYYSSLLHVSSQLSLLDD